MKGNPVDISQKHLGVCEFKYSCKSTSSPKVFVCLFFLTLTINYVKWNTQFHDLQFCCSLIWNWWKRSLLFTNPLIARVVLFCDWLLKRRKWAASPGLWREEYGPYKPPPDEWGGGDNPMEMKLRQPSHCLSYLEDIPLCQSKCCQHHLHLPVVGWREFFWPLWELWSQLKGNFFLLAFNLSLRMAGGTKWTLWAFLGLFDLGEQNKKRYYLGFGDVYSPNCDSVAVSIHLTSSIWL